MANPPPPLTVDLAPEQVLVRLDALARRGKLAGFQPTSGGPAAFSLVAYGLPFDYTLTATISAQGPKSTLTYHLRRQRKAPAITAATLALTVWPGVWLTDSMLKTYWSSYHFATWMWYLPLTILPIPWMWLRVARRSRTAAEAHATELAQAIRSELTRPA